MSSLQESVDATFHKYTDYLKEIHHLHSSLWAKFLSVLSFFLVLRRALPLVYATAAGVALGAMCIAISLFPIRNHLNFKEDVQGVLDVLANEKSSAQEFKRSVRQRLVVMRRKSGSESGIPSEILKGSFSTHVDGWVIKTEQEAKAVRALRARLQEFKNQFPFRPLNLSDTCMIRFLRARNMNINHADSLFREAVKFRETNHPDMVYRCFDPSPIMQGYMTGGLCGVDKEGTPIFFDRIGQMDVTGMMQNCQEQEFINFSIWRAENLSRQCLEGEMLTGKVQYQVVVVQDLKGLGWSHYNKKAWTVLKKCLKIEDDYYPERLKMGFFLNTPKMFTAIWSIVRLFLHENTRKKIKIFGNSATAELLQYIDRGNLPVALGGDLEVDGDPYCSRFIGAGGKIPVEKRY